MRLLVISHTPHIRINDKTYGWGPTVHELNFLAVRFKSLVHIAPCLSANSCPKSYIEVSNKIRVIPTVNRGGETLYSKVRVLYDSIQYLRLIVANLTGADIIHVRCPANISLIALIVLTLYPRKKKWIKYAGDWYRKPDFFSYKLQKNILRKYLRNVVVTINANPINEPKWIHHMLNPSYANSEIEEACLLSVNKILPKSDWIILFVGTLTENKGPDVALDVIIELSKKSKGQLFLIGNGNLENRLAKRIADNNLGNFITLCGSQDRESLKHYYQKAHFIILPSLGEGWPKVVSEGMAFGCIPIVSNVSDLKEILSEIGIGQTIPFREVSEYSSAISVYLADPLKWLNESEIAKSKAYLFSFEVWWKNLIVLFDRELGSWNID